MGQTTVFILGGCLLGALQLVVGIVIGVWLRRHDRADANRGHQDLIRANEIAKRLKELADEVYSSVGQHRTELDKASQLLAAEEGRPTESLTEMVMEVLDDIVRANQNLQSKLQTAESRLEEQAAEIVAHISRSLTDPLTGLPNRREFNDRLEERMAAWNRRREEFSLLLLDVDHFKKLNDQYGHLAGDQVLAAIGRVLRGAVRREDTLARYGGEEFAILMPGTPLQAALHVAEKVREAVSAISINVNGHQLGVTLSGGLAMIEDKEPAESLIQRADKALYMAKAAGRNRSFLHNGQDGRSTEEFRNPQQPGAIASELVELINAEDVPRQSEPSSTDESGIEVGMYLPRETVSPELEQACHQLKRHLEERAQHQQEAALDANAPDRMATPAAP